MRTDQKVKAQFTVPKLHEDRLTEWNLHVAKALGTQARNDNWQGHSTFPLD